MKCKTVHTNLIPYFNNELQLAQKKEIKKHIENCEACNYKYSQLEITFNLIAKKEVLEPDPFLYMRINRHLANLQNEKNQPVYNAFYIRALQPALFSLVLLVSIWGSLKLSSISSVKASLLKTQTTEFYFNDLGHEKMEVLLLKD